VTQNKDDIKTRAIFFRKIPYLYGIFCFCTRQTSFEVPIGSCIASIMACSMYRFNIKQKSPKNRRFLLETDTALPKDFLPPHNPQIPYFAIACFAQMNFNSIEFLLFLPVVFLAYWFAGSRSKTSQNAVLLVASYFMYMQWHAWFAIILAASTCINYFAGLSIGASGNQARRKWLLRTAVVANIGILAWFKYFNFFAPQLAHFLQARGIHWNTDSLSIILPVGLSFYTFHGLSYILDIYYKRIQPEKNLPDYAVFISFFPLLVAGPIERATHLLPQLKEQRPFRYLQAVAGLRLILWGMLKKAAVADSLATSVNYIFTNYEHLPPLTLILGVIGFSFQVYADFSGYSDIARGAAKLFGLEVFVNFNFPFFSRNIAEYWSRWHISLSTWLSDYVYTPLAIRWRNSGRQGIFAAIICTFILSGLWHGAGWNYIAWGILNGLLYLPLVYSKKGIKSILGNYKSAVTVADTGKILLTYSLVCCTFIFFRAGSLTDALHYIRCICSGIFTHPRSLLRAPQGVSILAYIIPLLLAEYAIMSGKAHIFFSGTVIRRLAYVLAIAVTLYCLNFYNERGVIDFIYFQF